MDDLLDKAPCGFLVFDDSGTILAVNATLLGLLGHTSEELAGRRIESILPVASRIFYQTHLFPLLKLHGKVEEIYLSLRSKGGTDIPVLANAVRRERDGRALNDCVFITMRQRSRYEDEILRSKKSAEEANRLKDEFLANVSHELRTPLTAMLGWMNMLRSGRLEAQASEHALDIIERNAQSLGQLVEDLLDVSRIISGKMRLEVGPIEPARFIEAAIESVSPAAEAKSVTIEKELTEGAGVVLGDAGRLQQVVWNLLSNAIKFTPRGGHIHLRLTGTPSHIEVSVSDTGIGINPEFLPYVFERFRQADQTTRRQHGGLGLGLAIVRHLVELQGGEVHAYSRGEGLGATFTVVLPRLSIRQPDGEQPAEAKQTAAASLVPSLEEIHRLDGLSIMVVDDEADTRELLTTMLRQRGAEVETADSAQTATELLRRFRPDVLISDIGMPGDDGYELIRRVRQLPAGSGGKTPAIALTAYARVEDRLRALQSGYQMHVPKPVILAELVTVITSLIERDR